MEFERLHEGIFFFAQVKREIFSKFANLYGSAKFDEIKAGIEQLTESYGWYLTIKQLAESGIFNRPDMNPLQSAENANLYEAFTYLSACAAENKYQNRLQEVISNKK